MKILVLLLFAFFTITKIKASSLPTDSTQANKLWKISQQQFLGKYGKDDTSKAIINYYFRNFIMARKALNVFLPVAAAASGIAIFKKSGSGGFVIVYIVAMVDIFTLSILGRMNQYSRKQLLKSLNKYFSGSGVSKKIKKWIKHQKI